MYQNSYLKDLFLAVKSQFFCLDFKVTTCNIPNNLDLILTYVLLNVW
jgi:hypothetical protein